jgi:putative PIN family toxin of toxin-antitoxin system
VTEVRRILARRFDWSQESIDEAEYQMRNIGTHITPTQTLDVVKDDPDDNRIVECAVAGASDYLVTGDKDLLRVGHYDNIRILNVSDFLALTQGHER